MSKAESKEIKAREAAEKAKKERKAAESVDLITACLESFAYFYYV